MNQRPVPKSFVFIKRVEAIDQTRAGWRSKRGGGEKRGKREVERGENSRCATNTPRIPGHDVVISTSQVVQTWTVASNDTVDTGRTRTACMTNKWGSLSGERFEWTDLG